MSRAARSILAVNAGSSSLKFALYPCTDDGVGGATLTGNVEGLEAGGMPRVRVATNGTKNEQPLAVKGDDRFDAALQALDRILDEHADQRRPSAIAHRIVHGGARLSASCLLDHDTLAYLDTLAPLAPLHQPHNLAAVRAFARRYPGLPQVGCFDTAFHATLPEVEQLVPLPAQLRESGVRRYGFHGLSYQYVSGVLLERSARARGRMLIAHLGNGASACALRDGKSIATTMGFSALDGLMMGTRSGALDPGIVLHLLRAGWDADRLERLLYRESGLRGVSGVSADMRTLKASRAPEAKLAIDLFIHRLVRECGALAACLGGLDVLAFTGGIGEHDAELRVRACAALAWLGVQLDTAANTGAQGDAVCPIHAPDSSTEVWVVPTDEGRVAAKEAARLVI